MKKHMVLFSLTALMLLCCSCAVPTQTKDLWAYDKNDGAWTERNRRSYLEVMYLYENVRPDEALTDEQLEASPDEQLLRLIDARYQNLPEERYMPAEDEMPYEEIKQTALSMLEAFRIADRVPDLCFSFLRRLKPNVNMDSEWCTAFVYEDGHHFRLYVNASDGSFQSWTRLPQGYWTNMLREIPPEAPQGPPQERTDEELLNAAVTYAEAALATDTSGIIESTTVVTTTSPYVQKDVRVILHPYQVYYISIDYNDLAVTSVRRK